MFERRILNSIQLAIWFIWMQGAPFTADWLGTSPLHLTAQYGRYETTEVCIRDIKG